MAARKSVPINLRWSFLADRHESTAKAVLLSRAGFFYHIPALFIRS
jgi:hypothetical protein